MSPPYTMELDWGFISMSRDASISSAFYSFTSIFFFGASFLVFFAGAAGLAFAFAFD